MQPIDKIVSGFLTSPVFKRPDFRHLLYIFGIMCVLKNRNGDKYFSFFPNKVHCAVVKPQTVLQNSRVHQLGQHWFRKITFLVFPNFHRNIFRADIFGGQDSSKK